MGWKEAKVKVRGETVTVKTTGSGQAMVVLHGWGSSFSSWEEAGVELGKNYKVYFFELPGFGEAPETEYAWGVSEYTDWVGEVITKLRVKKVVLLCHSNGGRVGMKLASSHPSWLSELVLVNSAGVPAKNKVKRNMFKYPAKLGKKVVSLPGLGKFEESSRKLLYKLAREGDYLRASGAMQEVMREILKYDCRVDATRIEVPSLLIWGGQDTYTPLAMGEELDELIADSKLVVISEATHGLPIKQPETLTRELNKWKGGR